jgi:pimeloyl-ACP methyl ester carboxylesterase
MRVLLCLSLLLLVESRKKEAVTVLAEDEFTSPWSMAAAGHLFSRNSKQLSSHKKPRSPANRFVPSAIQESSRMSIANMTCDFFTQPLNHFVPRGRSPTYRQRYCKYSGFVDDNNAAPIFFYTGNESPLEQYINNTGLMWELAPTFGAHVIFVEHRYEGLSLPNVSSQCLSYASTIQALADYAAIMPLVNPNNSALIAFGGSYGGMLSAWFRMKYPNLVAGAIAASAPIGGFPQNAFSKIDWSARVISQGLELPYPPTSAATEQNHCQGNLLAAFPLVTYLADLHHQGTFLQDIFRLCKPVEHVEELLRWAQSIWFDLAEGSFPYPSSYVPFALLHTHAELPAWPLQAACWKTSQLFADWGVRIEGNVSDVRYNVTYGNSGLSLSVDWDKVTLLVPSEAQKVESSSDVIGLLTSVRDAVSIWYNITKDVTCYDVTQAAPNDVNLHQLDDDPRASPSMREQLRHLGQEQQDEDPAQICRDKIKQVGSWEPLCCNDEVNLIITEAHGMGRDVFWPPSHPRGTNTYGDLIRNVTSQPCPDPQKIFGYSDQPYDLWSTWLDMFYGGAHLAGHSNIVFSNGLLDPWSAGGVYAAGMDPLNHPSYGGPMVQNITESIIALIIQFGGHHTDLMYSDERDPDCVKEARSIEKDHITKWIAEWHNN